MTTAASNRGDPGRQVHTPPLAALRGESCWSRPPSFPPRPWPAVPLLHPRRGRGRPRRDQHRCFLRLVRRFAELFQFIVALTRSGRWMPPHPLRRQHGRRRHHQGRCASCPATSSRRCRASRGSGRGSRSRVVRCRAHPAANSTRCSSLSGAAGAREPPGQQDGPDGTEEEGADENDRRHSDFERFHRAAQYGGRS